MTAGLSAGAFVIAADGINSRTARVLGMNKARDFYGTSRDTSYSIRGTACPDPDGFLFMITPRSIFSMIPVAEKNCYHIYASTTKRDEDIPALLRYFVNEDPTFSPWYKNSEILEHRTACVVSLMSPMELPVQGQCAVCRRCLLAPRNEQCGVHVLGIQGRHGHGRGAGCGQDR